MIGRESIFINTDKFESDGLKKGTKHWLISNIVMNEDFTFLRLEDDGSISVKNPYIYLDKDGNMVFDIKPSDDRGYLTLRSLPSQIELIVDYGRKYVLYTNKDRTKVEKVEFNKRLIPFQPTLVR